MGRMIKTIKPESPFNLELTLKIIENKFNGKEIYEYAVDHNRLFLVLNIDNETIPAVITSNGLIENPVLYIGFIRDVREHEEEKYLIEVEKLLNTRMNLKPFYKFAESDLVLHDITRRFKGLRNLSTPTIFEAFIRAFIEQQMPLSISSRIANRVIKNFGNWIKIDGITYYTFPSPEQLSNADEYRLRKCGMSSRKVEYIKNFSDLVVNGEIDLEKISKWDGDKIIDRLVKVRGIGKWTAEYVMVRGLSRYAYTPSDDLFLRKVISFHYFSKDNISVNEAVEICNKWGEWKGMASFYLIINYISQQIH